MTSQALTIVIGAGLAGLAAAHRLAALGEQVLVVEASDRVGGKLRTGTVAGVAVDTGAEAMLNRRPEGVALAVEVGLDVVHPAIVKSHVWSRGALCPLPRSLMGVPLALDDLAVSGVLSAEGVARVAQERALPPRPLAGDVSVGDLVAERMGEEVVDRLVEPLLGGVYAGHARLISAQAAAPQLLALAARGSWLEQANAMPTTYDAPVFATVAGGMGRLPEAIVDRIREAGGEIRTGVTVRALRSTIGGFALTLGPTTAEQTLSAQRVIVACPAVPSARLLTDLAPEAARELAKMEAASVAVVTFAFRKTDIADSAINDSGSGVLVPPVEARHIKAATFSFAKWAWVAEAGQGAGAAGEDLVFLRTSLGRAGEVASLQVDDTTLVARSLADLADLTGLRATPVATHVQRWGGGLPQYTVGHLDAVSAIRADVARVPGLAVCGAAYDGVGIPAVIASAQRAVADVLS